MQLLLTGLTLALTLAAQPPAPTLERSQANPVGAAVADDPEITKVLAPLSAEIHVAFGRVIAHAPKGIGKGAGLGDHPLGCLLADVMREAAGKVLGAEVRFAFTNSGGLRRTITPGDIHVQDIYEVLPFDNELVVAEYTGAEVIAIVKEGISRRGGEPCSGIQVAIGGSAAHPDLSITWSDGSAIDPAATYKAATTDYLLANGDGTPTLKLGRHVLPTGRPVRQLVIDACERAGKEGRPVLPPAGPRYVYSPEISEALKARTLKF